MKGNPFLTPEMRKFQPLNHMVLMRPIIQEKIGSFWIPDRAKEKNAAEAIVLAVGKGDASTKTGERIPLAVKPGDHVYVRYHFESAIEIDGETLMMLPENEIIGVREG